MSYLALCQSLITIRTENIHYIPSISLQGRIFFNMTMSVNDENSAGAANNNNCSKTADLDDHYANSPGDLRSQMWPPCPPPPPPPSSAWLPDEPPTYTPLVKVRFIQL